MDNFEDNVHAFRTGLLLGTLKLAGIKTVNLTDKTGSYTPVLTVYIDDEEGLPPTAITIRVLP